jgi:L-histidine N-alpha-methyltransferase
MPEPSATPPPREDSPARFSSPSGEVDLAVSGDAGIRAFADSVATTLRDDPPWLDSRFLYDARGSELFEQICELPEYYLTRTEAAILESAAPDIRRMTGPLTLMELGSGMSVKTDYLLDAFLAEDEEVRYVPVDISEAALDQARTTLEANHPGAHVTPLHGPYELAFSELEGLSPVLVLFLGSTLGNFNDEEAKIFWTEVASHLGERDFVLVGLDLVKAPNIIEAAYNDTAGVTAAFTKNLFDRMNRELGSELDLDAIEHEALYNSTKQQIEIYASFTRPQSLHIRPRGETIDIASGTTILTEISRKFDLAAMVRSLAPYGFSCRAQFTDDDGLFGLLLLQKTG